MGVPQWGVLCAGLAAQVGSASPFAGFEGYHCGWGPPATVPVPRTNDTWGMGWQNLYEVEVMEMKAADLTQACLLPDSIPDNCTSLLQCSLSQPPTFWEAEQKIQSSCADTTGFWCR